MDEVNKAAHAFLQTWQAFAASRSDKNFFASYKPTAIGWKVADMAEFDQRVQALRNDCNWYSVWLDGGEAKLRDDTVLDVMTKDLQDYKKEVLA